MNGEYPEAPYWELRGNINVSAIFSTLFTTFDNNYSLVLELSWPQPHIATILKKLSSATKESKTSYKAVMYEMPLGRDIPKDLLRLAREHAGAEYCCNAFVVNKDACLLSWFDFPFEPILISGQATDDIVRRISEKCQLSYMKKEK